MVQPGQALLNVIDDFENNRRKIVQETIAVKQHQMMTDLQVNTIKRMDEDAVNLPAGQFNAERYMEEFNTQSANLLNQFEDKGSRLRLEDMTTQVRGQLGLKANQYELKSLQAAQKAAKEKFYNAGIEQVYQSYNSGHDVLEDAPFFFSQADSLKPNLSFTEQQDLEEKKGDYAVITMNLRADQAMQQLLEDNITLEEYKGVLKESNRIVNEYPLTAEQRVKVNDIFSSEQARMVSIATNAQVAKLKENFDGYKTELIRTGKFPKGKKEEYAKAARLDSSLLGFLIEIDVVEREQTFYAAREKGNLRVMESELNKARQLVEEAKGTGKEFGKRDQTFQKLNVDYGKALAQRDKNFADFYKNDPRVKILKMQGLNGDMRPYVSYIQALAAEQGLDPSEITLLDEDYKQTYADRLSKAGKDVNEARRIALGIDQQFGVHADRIYGEILKGTGDIKVNALRYRNTPAFPKIWEAVTMTKEDISGASALIEVETKDVNAVINSEMRDYIDSRQAQGDTSILARVDADKELIKRLMLLGNKPGEIGGWLANRDFDYIKGRNMNVRVPKGRMTMTSDITLALRDPGIRKDLLKSKLDNVNLLDIPFTKADFEKRKAVSQPMSPYAATSQLFQGKEKSFADLTTDTIKDIILQEAKIVTGNDGIRFMVPTSLEGEVLQDMPLRDDSGKIIEYTWDELEMFPYNRIREMRKKKKD